MDRHRFDADQDQTFILMPIQIRIRIQIIPQILQMLKNLIFSNFHSQQFQFTWFNLSRQSHRCHNLQYFGHFSKLKFSGKKCILSLYLVEMDTGSGLTGPECRFRSGK